MFIMVDMGYACGKRGVVYQRKPDCPLHLVCRNHNYTWWGMKLVVSENPIPIFVVQLGAVLPTTIPRNPE